MEGLQVFDRVTCGQDLTVHTDYMNQLYNKLPSRRMMRWRLLWEESHLNVAHIPSVDSGAANVLSKLDLTDKADNLIIWGERVNV